MLAECTDYFGNNPQHPLDDLTDVVSVNRVDYCWSRSTVDEPDEVVKLLHSNWPSGSRRSPQKVMKNSIRTFSLFRTLSFS